MLLDAAIQEHAAKLARPAPTRAITFAEAATAWLAHLEHVVGAKPSTLSDYCYMLAPADGVPRKRGRAPVGRIDRAFSRRPLGEITTIEIKQWLESLDREDISPRTVNKHRQVVASVFEYAIADGEYGIAENPVHGTPKRRESDPKPIDTYSPEEVMALARAARAGLHRDSSRPAASESEQLDRAWADEQDACLYIVAAFTGLRLGELLALRWRHVSVGDARLLVESAYSAGELRSTKSRRWRAVPLADQAAAALGRLAARGRFIGRDDPVFCGDVGDPLDPSALRRRYARTQEATGVRKLRFHDLRHSFGTLVIREFDPATVKEFMGHTKLSTTERYLHARPRRGDAARLTRAFAGDEVPADPVERSLSSDA
ncbi:tyrosine-type recombinase/integrase [Conexibacter sp. DBS9H8]|uniref:tyrosine-type recombinase/integrase n=1 Tax=Conexibacter sp. DBS9H8 TaxID=2937801 RepID=UPI00200DD1CA|nr:tyrosine-type recombinase/integrase [Conexibacter sp. DBS9H8]